jgi:hypothetical protein
MTLPTLCHPPNCGVPESWRGWADMGQGLGSDLFAEGGEGGADHQHAQCRQ